MSENKTKRSFQKIRNTERTKAAQLREDNVGITEYISSLEGINGVIKARYSDFQVNEINLDGIEAKLTNTDVPEDFLISKCLTFDGFVRYVILLQFLQLKI